MINLYKYDVQNPFHNQIAQLANEAQFSVVIKTCRRLEVYQGTGFVERSVVVHLFRVAAGLDSPILGDSAIQNQLKLSYIEATQRKKLDKNMHRLFQMALQTGKMVRSATNIGKGAVSYANAAYYLIKKQECLNTNNHIAIVGINKMTYDIVKFLKSGGYNNITIVNRSIIKAEKFAKQWQTRYEHLFYIDKVIKDVDVLITATAAPTSIIPAYMFLPDKHYIIIDLGMPPNVEGEVSLMKNVKYYGLEQVENQLTNNLFNRSLELSKAESIINDMTDKFMKWQKYNSTHLTEYQANNNKSINFQCIEADSIVTGKFYK